MSLLSIIFILVILVTAAYAAQVNLRSLELRGGTTMPVMIDGTLRESAILTTSYVATNFARTAHVQDIGLWFDLEQGSLTSFQYKVQWSRDSNIWFDEVTESVLSGIITDATLYYTLTFGGDVRLYKPLPVRAPYIRMAVKGTGTVTGSTCAVYITGVND